MALANISEMPEHRGNEPCSLIFHEGHDAVLLTENFIRTLMIE